MTAAGPRSDQPFNSLVDLLARLQASGFEDLRGAEVSAIVPISERLLNEIVQRLLPRSTPLRDVYVSPQAGDRFIVRARVGSSPLLPALKLTVHIHRQPALPSSAVLVLRLEMTLMALAAPALRFFDALPPGLHLDRDLLYLDLARLLEQRGFGHYLDLVQAVEVHTTEGAVVASLRAGVPRG